MQAFKIYSAKSTKPPSDSLRIADIAGSSPALQAFAKHAWQTGTYHQAA